MPRNKDLKRLVRTRMTKTGEAYTAARAHIVTRPAPTIASRPAAVHVDYAAVAGMSDDKVKAKTGRTWQEWVSALDRHGAGRMPHRDIAELVSDRYEVGDWWTQTVTVGYERIKGLRARGQQRDGSYEVSKSRTYDVPVTALFDAWADTGIRRRWLDARGVRVRTATAPKSMRLEWTDRSVIAVGFSAKGASKSSVAVQHTKLPDRETADDLRRYWSARLAALAAVLSER